MSKTFTPRLLTILAFVGVLSLFLYIANLVVYEALAGMFVITGSGQLLALAMLLGVLSGSLIVSTILGMYYYNTFTRLYYLFSAIWIGFFVYLFLFSIVYGLLLMLPFGQFNYIGKIFILCAMTLSIYAIFHTYRRGANATAKFAGQVAKQKSDMD